MRVLQFVADGAAGGGSTVVLGLVEGLVQAGGNETHLLTDAGSYVAQKGRDLGATIHEGAFMATRTGKGPVERFHQVVDAIRPDVIHLHGSRAAFYGRALQTIPTAYTIHGYHFPRKDFLRRTLGRLGELASIRNPRHFVFVCEYDRQMGTSLGVLPKGANARVIYNGVSFQGLPEARPTPKTIAYINRMVEQKDPLMGVETMRHLAPLGYRLVMAGGGQLMEPVRERIEALGLRDAIEIRGEVPRTEAIQILATAEALLMTSRWEGLPLAPLEAMALGLPVVAPGICGIPEIITDGSDGILVDAHQAEAYAAGIQRLQDDALKARIIAQGKVTVAQKFSWEHCLAQHQKLYAEMAA